MLGGEAPTPLDLRFRLGPIPVRVSPLFWLIMALFGDWVFRHPKFGPVYLLIWVACGFVSILVHELGHALTFRAFGSPSAITLHGFGGYAETPYPPTSPWKRLVVALAGPAAGFALCGAAYLALTLLGADNLSPFVAAALFFLVWMNLVWNLINLVPVFPLDGGRVFREVCAILGARNPDAITHVVSIGCAGLLALRGIAGFLNVRLPVIDEVLPDWLRPTMFMTVWLILLAFENYQWYQLATRTRPRYYDDDSDTPPWRR